MRGHTGQVVWGLAFVFLGIGLLLANLGWLSARTADVWPLVVFVAGVWLAANAVRRPSGEGLTAGLVLMAVGAFWFGEGRNWIDEALFLPVLLVSIGLGLLLRGVAFRSR